MICLCIIDMTCSKVELSVAEHFVGKTKEELGEVKLQASL